MSSWVSLCPARARDEIVFMISWEPTPKGYLHRNSELKKPINYFGKEVQVCGCQPGYWNNFPMNLNSVLSC